MRTTLLSLLSAGPVLLFSTLALAAAPLEVGQLLEKCESLKGKSVRVTGWVTASIGCPSCPQGAVCKPCFGDHFVLSDARADTKKAHKDVAIVGRTGADLVRKPNKVIIEGTVDFSPGGYAVNPCMVKEKAPN